MSWLSEMVDLQGTPEQICGLLTSGGIETEVAADERPAWDGVITAVLKAVDRHPDADRLTVTKPFDGSTERQVVCGATNHKAGDIVALATVGTKLPNGTKIKKGKMRGQVSEGMLCSGSELGLSGEADGILILPPGTPIGVPLLDVLEAGEVTLESEPTANRGDCFSILGTARELAAVSGWPLKGRATGDDELATLEYRGSGASATGTVGSGDRGVHVTIEDAEGCPRYACAVLDGVKVGPSPKWMVQRLEAAGLRSVNNVVDCTNYVMLELGNPLHAFDRRDLRGGSLLIRRAGADSATTTLDSVQRTLVTDDLVIADGEGVVAIAGVMGGENSEVSDDTTTLLLESAHFDPASVRRTAHRLKLTTDASHRFARGVDPELPGAALLRLIELLQSTAGGTLDGAILDLYPAPVTRPRVELREARIAGLLGIELSQEEVTTLLDRDGLEPQRTDRGWSIAPPSYRFDIEREVDVLEEIVRLVGFDQVPERLPKQPLRSVPRVAPGPNVEGVRDALVAAGLSEAVHFSFIDPAWLERLGLAEDDPRRVRAVRIGNPLSEVGGVLRPLLLPSLLDAASRNLHQGASDVRLFELRTTFLAREGGFADILSGGDAGRPGDRPPVIERRAVAGVLVGARRPAGWGGSVPDVDFFDAKGAADEVMKALDSKGFRWTADGDLPAFLDPREAGLLVRPGREVQVAGWAGRIAVPTLRGFELDRVVYAFELDVDMLAPRKVKPMKFASPSRYPGLARDLAVVVPDAVPAQWATETAAKAATKASKGSFQGAEVFDVYRGKGIPAGHRSLALRLRFRAATRTLQDGEVDAAMAQVEKQLVARDGVSLRG
ncbi:MAG: phenylalanine--tRNA ligase subunit beta [Deltaproteobacteria bacterium]|nr:phenylalanine--tRNA ligase subunit beta [Deltaproteobacteria bacterium]